MYATAKRLFSEHLCWIKILKPERKGYSILSLKMIRNDVAYVVTCHSTVQYLLYLDITYIWCRSRYSSE